MLKKQIFLGIDPGLATTGFGIISQINNKLSLLDYGVIETSPKQCFSDRLEKIFLDTNKIIKKYQPEAAACEELFFCKNVKTALAVGQARGVILLSIKKNKLPLCEFTPLQVKQTICGYGQADKKQIQRMVKTLLKLNHLPEPDDAADALAIAIAGEQYFNSPLYEK